MRSLLLITSLILVGCGATPYQDDYTKHVNLLENSYFTDSNYKFSFSEENQSVDLRGVYSQDDTAYSTPIMYQGGAGLAGAVAQLATHGTIINSMRDSKLAAEQVQANQIIQPLINIAQEIPLNDLVGEHHPHLVNFNEASTDTIIIKPIFFSNSEMTELSIKSIVWIPLAKEQKKRKKKFKYKNMIQVYSPKMSETDHKKLLNGDTEVVKQILSSLLNTTLHIAEDALKGQYAKVTSPAETFLIENESENQVIRGYVVADKCNYQVIRDLRLWLFARPKNDGTSLVDSDTQAQCDSVW